MLGENLWNRRGLQDAGGIKGYFHPLCGNEKQKCLQGLLFPAAWGRPDSGMRDDAAHAKQKEEAGGEADTAF